LVAADAGGGLAVAAAIATAARLVRGRSRLLIEYGTCLQRRTVIVWRIVNGCTVQKN
jgi:hypothetical protein